MNTDYTAYDVVIRLLRDDAFRREFISLLADLNAICRAIARPNEN